MHSRPPIAIRDCSTFGTHLNGTRLPKGLLKRCRVHSSLSGRWPQKKPTQEDKRVNIQASINLGSKFASLVRFSAFRTLSCIGIFVGVSKCDANSIFVCDISPSSIINSSHTHVLVVFPELFRTLHSALVLLISKPVIFECKNFVLELFWILPHFKFFCWKCSLFFNAKLNPHGLANSAKNRASP